MNEDDKIYRLEFFYNPLECEQCGINIDRKDAELSFCGTLQELKDFEEGYPEVYDYEYIYEEIAEGETEFYEEKDLSHLDEDPWLPDEADGLIADDELGYPHVFCCEECRDKFFEEFDAEDYHAPKKYLKYLRSIKNEICHIPKEKIMIYDTETTGLKIDDEIIQFSACDGNGKKLMNTYIRPVRKKSWASAAAVNGITPEMVTDAPTIEDVKDQIQKIFDSADLIIAYNGGFDNRFLTAAGIDARSHAAYSVDVMPAFAEVYGQWDGYHGNYRWQKLTTAAAYYDFNWDQYSAHDSMGDVLATLHVYNCIIRDPYMEDD